MSDINKRPDSSSTSGNPNRRRSVRASPLRRPSFLIPSPSDSCRSHRRNEEESDGDSSVVYQSSQRKRRATDSDDDLASQSNAQSDHSVTQTLSRRKPPAKRQRKTKANTKPPANTDVPASSSASTGQLHLEINLTQNSDDENNKVLNRAPKKPKVVFDPIRDYFFEGESGEGDVSSLVISIYVDRSETWLTCHLSSLHSLNIGTWRMLDLCLQILWS